MQLVAAILNNTGLVGETVVEAGDPVMQMDWAGSREGHTVGHLSVEWGRMVSRGKDQERPRGGGGICDGY